jgi:imidazolonepropionase
LILKTIYNCARIFSPSPVDNYHLREIRANTIHLENGRISGFSNTIDVPDTSESLDAKGALVLPGFVDSHTHPVFFENRANEYEMRNAGRSYLEIQQAGGGILSSRRSLQGAEYEDLKTRVKQRLLKFMALGTTTIEAKSGYGLSIKHELLSLELLKELQQELALNVYSTLLAAHSVPPEFSANRDIWFNQIVDEIIPLVKEHSLAEFIDAFCEPSVITFAETRKVLTAGLAAGLKIKLHADQIEAAGGAQLAAGLGALSVDHLEQIDTSGIDAMIKAGSIFGLLPGSVYFLGLEKYAPAREIISRGGKIALCTDYNPGSSHIQSMPFILSLATSQMKMSAEEAIWSATMGGAMALGIEEIVGSLEVGYKADICLWPFNELCEMPYHAGDNRPQQVIVNGCLINTTI